MHSKLTDLAFKYILIFKRKRRFESNVQMPNKLNVIYVFLEATTNSSFNIFLIKFFHFLKTFTDGVAHNLKSSKGMVLLSDAHK